MKEEKYDRLGIRSVEANGRPSLDNRWDIAVYEEGLQDGQTTGHLENPRSQMREESDRLIAVAKKVGDYIPSSVWDSFGLKVKSPSGESIVFTDTTNGRVVKFKDPFAYIALKGDNPYTALYEHHIHNHFFGDTGYRFLGVSQDPVSGSARFAFEQPLVEKASIASEKEIDDWFSSRGFERTKDGFWYTDGYVSFTDVWGDNCMKDKDGNLRFIDPIIKFDREPKEVITHYVDQSRERVQDEAAVRQQDLAGKLERAGIAVGSRFRIDGLCSDNDQEVLDIDYQRGMITLREYNPSAYHDDKPFEWSIEGVLENIKARQCYRWVQIDEHRHDIVIPAAKEVLFQRVRDTSRDARLSDDQVKALDRFSMLFSDDTPKEEIYTGLIDRMRPQFKEALVPDSWINDARDELVALAHGERRNNNSLGLQR